MASFNRVILMGNLTRDPELRYIPSGMAVCEIGLAVNDRRKNSSGEWVDETTFVDVTFWGRSAEVVCEYLTKGSPIMLEGRLKLDQWESNDGQKRSKLRVVAERMQMVGGKGEGGRNPEGARSTGSRPAAARSGAGAARGADAGARGSDGGPSYDDGDFGGSTNFSNAPADQPPEDDIPF